jgi:hypothetical protein
LISNHLPCGDVFASSTSSLNKKTGKIEIKTPYRNTTIWLVGGGGRPGAGARRGRGPPPIQIQQQPGHSGGVNYYQQQPGGNKPPTSILPMAPLPLLHQSMQGQLQGHMQGIQSSSYPRPNFVTTVHGGETEPPEAEPYTGEPRTPQVQWQPTPFVPPAPPSGSPGMPSSVPRPSTNYSSTVTAVTSTNTAASFREPQLEVSPSVDHRLYILSMLPSTIVLATK